MWKDLISGSSFELKARKQYAIKISNKFADVKNLNDRKGIIGLGRTLKGTSKPQLKTVDICRN